LVGKSGSGKTTIARTIAGLHPVGGGTVLLHGERLPALAQRRSRVQRRTIQMVFQNPSDALNPRQTIGQAISRPARLLRGLNRPETEAEVDRLLGLVRLPPAAASRFPFELRWREAARRNCAGPRG
jgi:peptide/nickel transport system ATP-binding protein